MITEVNAVNFRQNLGDMLNQVQYRNDKAGIVHCTIGRASFAPADLQENLVALIEALQKAKPAAAKGIYLKRMTVSSTMGVGIRIDQASLAG